MTGRVSWRRTGVAQGTFEGRGPAGGGHEKVADGRTGAEGATASVGRAGHAEGEPIDGSGRGGTGRGGARCGIAWGGLGIADDGRGGACGPAEGGRGKAASGKVVADAARARKPRDERGAIGVAFAILLPMLLMMAAFAIDLGICHIEKATQNDLVEQVEADQMKSAKALVVKNSETPGLDITKSMITELRELGYTGEITAYFYEPSKAESGLGNSERVYVYGLTLEQDQPTIFGTIFGTKTVEVSTTKWSWGNPYAQSLVWSPSKRVCGYVHVDAGQDASAVRNLTLVSSMNDDQMPGGKDVLEKAIKSAKES